MGVRDRYYEKKKKQDEEEKKSTNSTSGVKDRYEQSKYYDSLDTSGVNQDFINTFISDISSFIETAEKEYGSVGWGNASSLYENRANTWNDLSTRYDTVKAWLYKNRSQLGEETYKSLNDSLDSYSSGASSIVNSFKSASDLYSQFDSEEAYNNWYKEESEYQKYFENIDTQKASNGWQKYLDDTEASKQQAIAEEEDKKWWEKALEAFLDGQKYVSNDPISGTMNATIDAYREDISYMRPNDEWDENQRNAFGILYLQSPAKAYAFAEETNKRINKAKEDDAIRKIQESATDGFWSSVGHTAGAIASAPMGLADYLDDLAKVAAGREITADGNISPFEYSQAVTGGISSHLNEQYGVIDEDVWLLGGKGWGDVYGLGTSIAQSAVSGLTMGSAGTLISYFGQGAASGVDDALRRGATESQAVLYGVALGAFEGIAEKIGIDNLFKIGSSATFKELAKNVLRQAGAEGLEEGLTSLLGNIADNVIMQDKSNFNAMVQAYMNSGLSEEEAKNKAWWDSWGDIAFDTIGGFVSGGVHAGGATAFQTGISNYKASKTYGDGSALVDEALKYSSEGSDLKALAEKYSGKLEGGKSLSGRQINLLNEAIANNDVAMIKSAAEARLTELGEKGDVAKIANIIAKQATGETLTLSEKNTLKNSTFGQRVSNEANPDNINSGEYSSAWAENIGTRRVSPETYNKPLYELAKQQAAVIEAAETDAVAKSVAENQKASETELKVSESGKTTYTDAKGNTSDVAVQKVVSTKGGIKVKLDNGETVSAKDLSFSSENEAQMYEMVARMEVTPETANVLLNAFKPTNANQSLNYLSYVPLAYKYGQWNYEAGLKNLKLSKSEKSIAFKQGRKDAEALLKSSPKVKVTQKNNATETDATKTDNDGIIYEGDFTYDESTANEMQKEFMKGADAISKMSNLEVHVFQSVEENGERVYYLNGEKKLAPNGYFTDGNKIYIDFYAGDGGEGAMLYTMSHEITHYIRQWNPKGFKEIADFLIAEYGKHNIGITEMLNEQKEAIKEQYERDGKPLPSEAKLDDMAYEELVADAMSDMFADPKAYEKLAKFKQKNHNAWKTLGEAIKAILDKLKNTLGIYRKGAAVAQEAELVRGFTADVYNKLQDLYIKAFVEADATFETAKRDGTVNRYLNNRDLTFNLRATKSHKAKLSEQFSKDASIDLETLTQRYDKIISLWESLGGELDSKFLTEWNNKVGKDRAFTVFKAQAGYKYNVELSSMCKKGVPLFEAIDTIVKEEVMKELNTKQLGKEEKEILYDLLKSNDFEIPCAICYVEQARQREGAIIDSFLNGKVEKNNAGKVTQFKLGWNEVLKSVEKEMKALGVEYTFSSADRSIATDQYAPSDISMDVATQDAFYKALKKIANEEIARYNKAEGKSRKFVTNVTPSAIKEVFKGTLPSNLKIFKVLFTDPTSRFTIENDLLYSSMTTHNLANAHNGLYSLFNSQGGVSGYKTKQGTVVYWGDILGKKWKPSTVRDEGGIRNQSNSDFQMYTLLDQAQMYIDFTAKGYYLQAYTKVLSELKLFGLSRGKINASLIPAVYEIRNADGSVDIEATRANAGLDKNGNLLFDDIEGINHNEAFMLLEDAEYSKSIGGICIGYSDAHILKLLDDGRVQQIIGFHDKTDDPNKRYRGARYAKNYNGFNEAIDNKDGKTVHIGFNPYVKKAEKKFTFNTKTEVYEGTVVYNGKTYTANDIPKLATDLYLEMCEEKGYTPAYADFASHENYYKLLADFSLYDSQGNYAPHRKVAFNMPDTVPYLDINGKKQYMPTKDYIKSELEKELKVRDAISEALADKSESGLIPQFIKRVNESKQQEGETKFSTRNAEARRTKALETFGTTTNFKTAGFVLPHGQMLNLSQYGLPGVQHKRIEAVFDDDIHGAEAVAKFINDGNVRIIERSPGIELSTKVAPTISQFNTLGRFIDQCSSKGRLYVDFTDENGENIGSITYDGDIDTEDVFYDIEKYYKTGKLPEQRNGSYSFYSYSTRKTQGKITADMTEAERYEALKKRSIDNIPLVKAIPASVVKKISEISSWTDIDEYLGKDKRKLIQKLAKEFDVFGKEYFNEDIDLTFEFSANNFRESYNKQKHNYVEFAKMFSVFDAVIEGAVGVEIHNRQDYKYDPTLDNVFVLMSAYQDGAYIIPVKLEIKQFNDKQNTLYVAISLEKIKMTEVWKQGNTGNGVTQNSRSVNISIAKIFEKINPSDKSFLKYIPDGFLDTKQKAAKQEALTEDGKMSYSLRGKTKVSDRTLLANALDSVAQNDIEKNKLAQYKKKIALIESEQAKLNEIKVKANELRFTKGRTAEETRTMRNLEFEANQIANRINTYDKQLMSLESTAALKGVLEREKTMLRKKLAQKERESIKAVKQKAAQTQREIVTHYQESRKKAIESRNKTEMRHKIKKVVSDLNKLLLHPTKDQHVPIGLQGVVAEALDAINMDTMNAEERVAYYNDLIAKSSDPDEIAMLTKKRDFFDYRDLNFKERITALKNAYAEFKTSDDPLIRNAHNDAIEELIKNTADTVGKKSLKDMSYEQLDAVHNMYTAVLATVRNSNKLFKEGRQETVSENSELVKREVREVGGHHDRVLKITKFLKKFGWNMLKPVYAMKVIGSNTFTKLFDNVRKAEDTWAVDVREAKQFYEDVSAKYGYKKWDFKKQYTFKDSTGADFSLSLEQIMSLYAYSKREQADEHLEFGGFIFDESIEVIEKKHGIPLKYEVNDADPHRLRKEDILPITATLTSEQISFIDEMQSYLSDVMGAKGNEVSLAMYDIKLYNEKNYFPLKTSRYFREFDPEQNATPKLKNAGFSKKTVPQAGNPIVLSNFMDVWANHVNDMSMYHAFVLPLEDFMRVYNYSSTAGGYDSVQQYLKNAYGSQANQYIEKLMDDLNGGARVDSAADVISKGISLFKKSAVFASASVVIQQPSAIARSLAYINPKYFVTSSLSAMNVAKHGKVWDEVKKYAPVAVIKEMGYFDTGVGRSTVEWIKGNQTLREKADDVLSKAPAVADELTWCYIWEAVKRETKATTNLKVGSEEFLKKSGQRFTEVIVNTQVYDSVLSRSGMMRSKDTGMKMATAFMAEPTTAANMVINGLLQGKRGNKKFMAASVGAVSASIILNSMLVALVYAARDDDEDETYAEKYIGSLTTELIDGFNPLTYLPFVKDMWSIAQGYDVERSDMSVISDLWKTIESIFNEDKAGWEKVADVTGAVSSLFGIPAKNLIRDAKGAYNLFETVTSGTPTTGAGISDAVEDAVKNSIPLWDRLTESDTKSDKLYEAIMSGDQAHIDRVKSGFTSEDALKNAMRAGLRENDSRINEAAQARLDGDISKYTRIAKEIIAEGNFSQDIVVGAINAEMTAIKKGESSVTEETEDKDEVTSIYKASDMNAAFDNGDTTLALEIISDLIKTKVANGMEEKNAKSSVKSSMTSYWKPLYKAAYQSGNTTEMARIRKILYSSGLYGKSSDVLDTCKDWLKN